MHWEKKICFRLTIRRLVGAILVASTVTNLVIVGAAFGADSPPAPTVTAGLTTPLSASTFLIPDSGGATAIPTSIPPPETTLTDTSTPTQPAPDSVVWIVCIKKFYWQTYRVQPGDTLFSLAVVTGSSVAELRSANCLNNDLIYTGQLLYVPRLLTNTFTPTPSATLTNAPTYTLTATQTSTDPATVAPSPTPTGTPTYTPTYTLPPPADLVAAVLQVMPPAEILPGQETIDIPIYALIQNQGGSDAGIFKLSAHYSVAGRKLEAPFTVSDQSDNGYLYSSEPLAGGHEVAFTGTVSIPITLQGQTIGLSVLADSCSGDESMPAYCRVDEGNENNNESQPFPVRLPSNHPPSVVITVPDADKSFVYGDQILLKGSATDPEDGVLSGSAMVWSSDGIQLGTGAEVDVTAYINDACGTSFIFTLTAIDHDNNVATARRKIDLICPVN